MGAGVMDKLKAVGPHLSPPRGWQEETNGSKPIDRKRACVSIAAYVDVSGVTSVWELFRAVMRNTINEDLAQAGPGPRDLHISKGGASLKYRLHPRIALSEVLRVE